MALWCAVESLSPLRYTFLCPEGVVDNAEHHNADHLVLRPWIKAGAALGLAVAAQLTYAVPGVALVAVVVAVAISSALRAKQDLAWEKRYSRQYCASKMLDRIRFLPV
jgi:hypothetical protein